MNKKFDDIFNSVDTTLLIDGHTDWQTDTGWQQRPRLHRASQ